MENESHLYSLVKDLNLVGIIMAGGAGTRFWPVSTANRPKQFLNLFGGRTLIQESFDRLNGIIPPEKIMVLTNSAFVPLVREQLPEIPERNIIGEPCRRDTSAAVALAAALSERLFGPCVNVIVTADHRIVPVDAFRLCLATAALEASRSQALYTLGIKPHFAATGYGYLHAGAPLEAHSLGEMTPPRCFRVEAFKEKPNLETAQSFINAGCYFWNSGMFIWKTESIAAEFERLLPQHISNMRQACLQAGTPGFDEALAQAFEPLPRISIDFGIMEHAQDVRMVEGTFQWFDVGSWMALAPHLEHDDCGNSSRGMFYSYDSHGNIIFSDDPQHSISLVGVENMAVIYSQGHTLVVPCKRLEDVKKLTAILPEHMR